MFGEAEILAPNWDNALGGRWVDPYTGDVEEGGSMFDEPGDGWGKGCQATSTTSMMPPDREVLADVIGTGVWATLAPDDDTDMFAPTAAKLDMNTFGCDAFIMESDVVQAYDDETGEVKACLWQKHCVGILGFVMDSDGYVKIGCVADTERCAWVLIWCTSVPVVV